VAIAAGARARRRHQTSEEKGGPGQPLVGELAGPGRAGVAWLGEAFLRNTVADEGEIDGAVDAVVCDAEDSPVSPVFEGDFNVVERDVGAADGDFITVVTAVPVCYDGDELSGAVEDAWVVAGGEVSAEPQLARLVIGRSMKSHARA
jgi:hypothetical protein